jgi:DNA-binding XRE family transcriptional regulator
MSLEVKDERIHYRAFVTVVDVSKAHCGYWWTRGDRLPWLPVMLNVFAARASGIKEIANGDCFDAEVIWVQKRAMVFRPRRVTETDIDERVGRCVRDLRMKRRMSQRDLAARIGVTPATMKNFENGRQRIGSQKLSMIAAVLDAYIHKFY